jgi:alpha-galactosidase
MPRGVIAARGGSLWLNGAPYRFTGINAYDLATDWSVNKGCGTQVNDLDGFFGQLRDNSLVRFWAFQDLATNKTTGVRDWTGMDRVMAAAERHHQRVIMVLGNEWGVCDHAKDTSFFAGGYRTVVGGQLASYWDYLHEIVGRYRTSPALGMWELINEPEVSCGAAATLRSFFDTVGGELKRLDPTHLLESGVIGGNQCGLAGNDYLTVQSSPAVDVVTYHDYNAPNTVAPDELRQRLGQAAAMSKPLIIGEAGVNAGSSCTSVASRRDLFKAKMDAQFGLGAAGFMPWYWAPRPTRCGYEVAPGDPTLALLHDYPLGALPSVSGPTVAPSPMVAWAGSPPMGFNHYNHFGDSVNEKVIREIAAAMATNGMRAAGYSYVNLDDSWQGDRDANGNIHANGNFPGGLKALADYVHSLGLKFGLYTTPAATSCGGRTGSAGHVQQDVNTFASWDVDFIKLDWCGADTSTAGAAAIARQWISAVASTNRPIVLSINASGDSSVPKWASGLVTMWRTGDDVCASWYNKTRQHDPAARDCFNSQYHNGIYDYLYSDIAASAPYVAPGHWADPDMLETGNPGLSFDEAKTQFSMWAMWSAPLIAGNDPRAMAESDEVSTILLNREVIAIDQDPRGAMATKVSDSGGLQVWTKMLAATGTQAAALVNATDSICSVTLSPSDLGWMRINALRDLWSHTSVPLGASGYQVTVPPHGTVLLTAVGQ